MKKLLMVCAVISATVGMSACSTLNLKAQQGAVKIEVSKVDIVNAYQNNLNDLYQVMNEGLMDSAKQSFEALKSEFLDGELINCEKDLACEVIAYEKHFTQLHQFIYKNDLSNVEPVYIEAASSSSDYHVFEMTGFYGFVGQDHQRLALFIDVLEIDRNEKNSPSDLIKIESIDAILYRQNLGKAAEFKAMGQRPFGKMIRLGKPVRLESLFYSINVTDIEFTDFTFGLSFNLGNHEYEINTFKTKLKDIREYKAAAPIQKSLY
ncbi:hypothetical protein [Marinicellulosiphila megalodicopiae]|uniref:hypothetical protein n=1 Tax=Marinicellulosiphila megalodicopiae TaxID=2724896 RepID=UPI003BAFFC82